MKRLALGLILIVLLGQGAGFAHMQANGGPFKLSADPTQWVLPNPGGDDIELSLMISVDEAYMLFEQDALFIDARPYEDYVEGHVTGAIHLDPLKIFDEDYPDSVWELQLDQPIVVYCPGGDCDASEVVVNALQQEFGMTRAHILEPGFPAWVDAGYSVTAGEEP